MDHDPYHRPMNGHGDPPLPEVPTCGKWEPLSDRESRTITKKLRKMVAASKANRKDPEDLAGEMIASVEHGKLIELRCDPAPGCKICGGRGHNGALRNGKHEACSCCAMPEKRRFWCNKHQWHARIVQRKITCLVHERPGDPMTGDTLLPCQFVELTALAEIFDER